MKSLFLALLLCASAVAEPTTCFSQHVTDAIQLNTDRAPLYSSLSYGDSRWLSKDVIYAERWTWLAAKGLEFQAKSFWRAGIPVLCADFASMSTVPPFQSKFSFDPPRLNDYKKPDVERFVKELKIANNVGFTVVRQTALRLLKEIEEPRGFHCLTRHVLESIARVAYLAPHYETMAKTKGLLSPAGIEKQNISLHLQGLKLSASFDDRAAPLQAKGIPILCQDVPPLDLTPQLR